MKVEEARNSLIKDLEELYLPEQIKFIDERLKEIAEEENLTMEDLDYYCTLNSSEMFACIFNYKPFDRDYIESVSN